MIRVFPTAPMATYSARRVLRVKETSPSISDSSSSSSSSFGLKTPEWGATTNPHLANLDNGLGLDGLSLHDPLLKGKASESTIRAAESSRPPFEELAAPPPLSLPRAFLLPRPAPPPPSRTSSTSSNASYIPEPDITSSTTPRANNFGAARPRPSSQAQDFGGAQLRPTQPSTPLRLLRATPSPLPWSPQAAFLPPGLAPRPPQPKPHRRKRGRPVSVHLLWRSSVDAEALKVLRDFYEWKQGEGWPELDPNGENWGEWSAAVEAAGL